MAIPSAPTPAAAPAINIVFFLGGGVAAVAPGSRGGGRGFTCGVLSRLGACDRFVNSTGLNDADVFLPAGVLPASDNSFGRGGLTGGAAVCLVFSVSCFAGVSG